MEREGWDFENQQFIDFDDEDNEPFSKLTNHTHINQRSLSESAATKRKPEIQNPGEEELNSLENSEEEAIIASSGNTILTNFLRLVRLNYLLMSSYTPMHFVRSLRICVKYITSSWNNF
ncbi:MAG: hypothetical protein ACXVHU_01990 [Methanobacterium sp.]